eukprot:Ihof_evm31s18 gene=Ihof_evmTU31s18
MTEVDTIPSQAIPVPQETEKDKQDEEDMAVEDIRVKLVYNRKTLEVSLSLQDTVGHMKKKFEVITGVPAAMQKVMYKGMLKDDRKTLQDAQVKDGVKIMVVGSSLKDVLTTVTAPVDTTPTNAVASVPKVPRSLSDDPMHKKVLDKGKPDDIMEAHKGMREPWPMGGIRGMHTRQGQKLRLSWKPDEQEVWIGTQERTEKLPIASIHGVDSEPIKGHEEYHIMAIKLGISDASK